MLNWLTIKNFTLIEFAEINFQSGFNVITGETGVGKSIMINAISLLMGKRADKSLIRTGSNKCELCCEVKLNSKKVSYLKSIFTDNDIEFNEDNTILIRKTITNSASKNFVNDTPISLNTLTKIGTLLLDYHGPTQNYSLLKPSFQLKILDTFGEASDLVDDCQEAYNILKLAEQNLLSLKEEIPDAIELENIRKIIRDIEACEQILEQDEELNKKFLRASNSKEILEQMYLAKSIINESDSSITVSISELSRIFSSLQNIDSESADSFGDRINKMSYEFQEIAIDIDTYIGATEIDEEEYYHLEENINSINSLKRKYGQSLEQIYETLEKARHSVNKVDNYEEMVYQANKKVQEAQNQYNIVATKLSTLRKQTSKKFAALTKEKLSKLGFNKADISVELKEVKPTAYGCDSVEIMFCPNIGEENKPLRSIASSGEISRVMLAIKTVLSHVDEIPILIFDEIDANIGGEIAVKVADELNLLGESHQLICISHLPQIASKANVHYKVDKYIESDRTYSKIDELDGSNRTEEIARMLGGNKGALAHAKELLAS